MLFGQFKTCIDRSQIAQERGIQHATKVPSWNQSEDTDTRSQGTPEMRMCWSMMQRLSTCWVEREVTDTGNVEDQLHRYVTIQLVAISSTAEIAPSFFFSFIVTKGKFISQPDGLKQETEYHSETWGRLDVDDSVTSSKLKLYCVELDYRTFQGSFRSGTRPSLWVHPC